MKKTDNWKEFNLWLKKINYLWLPAIHSNHELKERLINKIENGID